MTTSRRAFIKQSLVGVAAASLAPSLLLAEQQPVKLTILHTNDMHSRIEPFPSSDGKFANLGGMARRASLIKKIRAEEKNVLLFDSGDIFQGTPYFNFFGGELEFKLMSQMGYDAATFGNHDFDNGLDGLDKMLPHAQFTFVNANYDFSQTNIKGKAQPYKIFTKEDIKIGVFGVGIQLKGLVPDNLFGNIKYNDPVAVAKEMVVTLKAAGCHFIVCLSHLGYHYSHNKVSDHTLAQEVEGIDLILGGHTHSFLEKPTQLLSPSGNPVYINQVGWAGIRLGRLDFVFTKGKKKELVESNSLLIENKSSEK